MGQGQSQIGASQSSGEEEELRKATQDEVSWITIEPAKIAPEDGDGHAKAIPRKTEAELPHKCATILKDADFPVDMSSTEKLYDQLKAGVFLNKERQKYWIDNNSNNCFMLLAKDLSITWAEDNRFWHWPYMREASDVLITVAELLNVCWLEVHAKFETEKLTPGAMYEVVLVMMLRDPAYGWEVPVNFRLTLPDGGKQEHEENLMEKLRGRWIEIPIGEFRVSEEKVGEIDIYIHEYYSGVWKRGLVIKGVAIRPKS